MDKTKIYWHPATESPGKKRFVGAFISKDRKENQMVFKIIRYFTRGVIPCECHEPDGELCVAWAYYKDFLKGITPNMITSAKNGAWGWWNEDKKK